MAHKYIYFQYFQKSCILRVTIEVANGIITVKGKNGQLTQEYSDVTVTVEGNQVQVDRSSDHKDQRAKHGLYRALINNMILGVTEWFY